jgi:uncharacterized protein (DUF2336 family)
MLIRRFLDWADQVSAGERAEGTAALALAYLYSDLDPVDQGEAERVLTLLLDDPSPLVRRAMAESFATAVDAPRHIVVALAADQADVAAIILGRSPLLTDAELIDAAAIGDAVAQTAVAHRPSLSAAVAGALAEVGQRAAVLALCANPGARLTDFSVLRLIERFGHDGDIRAVLGARADLGACLRHGLVLATIKALTGFVGERSWVPHERLQRIAGEEQDRACVMISVRTQAEEGEPGQRRFAAYLLKHGHLTPALLLRSLLSGHVPLLEAALCELSGRASTRIGGLLRNWEGLGFAALFKKAGLPETLLKPFRAALAALDELDLDETSAASGRLQRRVIERVLGECSATPGQDAARVTALLRRFEAEAAREEARALSASRIPAQTKPPVARASATERAKAPPPLQVAA